LEGRLKNYFNIYFLENEIKKNKSMIYKAFLKYGYSKFSLEILEYCDSDKRLEREQYYMNLLNPEYNISKSSAAPMTGRSHSEETRDKMSSSKRGRKHTKETRAMMSSLKTG
jgi:group I intron endonuclease